MRAGLNFSPQYFQGLRRCLPGLNEVDMRSMRRHDRRAENRPSRRDVSARGLPPPARHDGRTGRSPSLM